MKKKRIIIALITIVVCFAIIIFTSDSKNTDLPSSLLNISVPPDGLSGELIPVGTTTYYGFKGETYILIVPENRRNSDSRFIALPIIKIPALDKNKEPIFPLAGGPGITNMKFKNFGDMIKNHDIILVGYRGVDGSVQLNCNNVTSALRETVKTDLLSDESLDKFKKAVKADFEYLSTKGIDLNGYNIVEVADDIDSVRSALGYKRINLLSESYGTRIAMIYSLKYRERIYRSVMIGANPPGHFLFSPDQTDKILLYYSSLYKGDENLSETIKKVLDNIPDKWLWFNINKGSVKSVIFTTLFYTEGSLNAAVGLNAILDANKGDYSGLAFLSLLGKYILPTATNWGDLFSKAISADLDELYDYRNQFTPAGSILGAPVSKLHWSAAEVWPVDLIDKKYRTIEPMDVETLLISGNIDVSTPAVFAQNELLPYLKNGNELILSDFGHTQDFYNKQPDAAMELLYSYFENGEVKKELFSHEPFSFETIINLSSIMKIITVLFVLMPLLVSFILLKFVNRIKNNKAKELKAPLQTLE